MQDTQTSSTKRTDTDDIDWSFKYSNDGLKIITGTKNITNFCKIQHLKYLAHVSRLDNFSLQKQIIFSSTRKKYHRSIRVKMNFYNASTKIYEK